MSEPNSFADLLRGVRSGDPAAAEQLVKTYEPHIRRAVRIHLRDARLRRLLDGADVCQSVLASFFVRAASGQYELDNPEQLVRLLMAMARNKIASRGRKQEVVRREERDLGTGSGSGEEGFPAPEISPSAQIAGRDLLEEFRKRLSEEERFLVDQRALGREWADIGAGLGASPEALRKKHARALDRVARELGLDEMESG
jgi:RNA polymerase sigma-70 factor (ECF subfamily)